MKKSQIVVAELPGWATADSVSTSMFMECVELRIPKIFDRDGEYFDRKTGRHWIECDRGAFELKDVKNFLFENKLATHRPLPLCDVYMIEQLVSNRNIPKRLRKQLTSLLNDDRAWKSCRYVSRSARKYCLKVVVRKAENP